MLNGIIIVNKEKNFTSHDVVAKLRGILKQKKIGHTGTLDPQAQGVLPVCLGNATKLCDVLTDKKKEYVATLLLGVTTDTEDMTGNILTQNEVTVTEEKVREVVASFVGKSMQVPPMYSALKVNGKKLYELAREGKVVEREARPIEVYELEILSMDLPRVELCVFCSKGTYIRTLCADIGAKLGCGGAMESLLRTRVEDFYLKQAHTLSEIEEIRDKEALDTIVIPVDEVFGYLPKIHMKPEFAIMIENGNTCPVSTIVEDDLLPENGQRFLMYHSNGLFYGIYEYVEKDGLLKPYKMFIPKE